MYRQLDDLIANYDSIRSKTIDFEKRSEFGLQLYRALNRFISFYLTRINEEEKDVQPTFWRFCMNKDLADALHTIITSQKPEELKYNFAMMVPVMNLNDQIVNRSIAFATLINRA